MEFNEGVYLSYLLFEDVRKCFPFNNFKKIFYLITFVEKHHSLVRLEKNNLSSKWQENVFAWNELNSLFNIGSKWTWKKEK